MIKTTADTQAEQIERLDAKTQEQRLINQVVEGTQMSPWEARVLVDIVKEVFLSQPGRQPMRCGQMLYSCVLASEGAGKPLRKCQMATVALTLIDPEDRQVEARQGHDALRVHRLLRITEEAREQGGLLSQEDLAQLLFCDVRTIRRDVQQQRQKHGIFVATRGQQKDIGPGVTHKAVALKHWLQGKEPVDVARAINHSLTAVERYLQHFSRVVFLKDKAFAPLQIAFTVGISTASVKTYLEIHESVKDKPEFKKRLEELQLIGAAHWQAGDEKKGALSPSKKLNSAWN